MSFITFYLFINSKTSLTRSSRSGRLVSRALASFASPLSAVMILTMPPIAVHAAPVRSTEIRVTLFGQPCILSGPFDEMTLKAIHSISPEQIYPPYLYGDVTHVSSPQIKKALERVRKSITPIPNLLDRYREKLGKRLDEMVPFFEGLEALQRTGKPSELISGTQKNLKGKAAQSSFAAQAKKLGQKRAKPGGKTDPEQDLKNKLFETYDSSIEPDPQEEFHRAIRKLNINYACSYDDNGQDEENE